MNATVANSIRSTQLAEHLDAACARIAPTWPLDQFIAVNPYWGWRSTPIAETAATLGTLAGTALTMPRAWYQQQWAAGVITDDDLTIGASLAGDPSLVQAARLALYRQGDADAPVLRLALATDIVDANSAPRPGQRWSDHVTHEISQHCGAYFDATQASWQPHRERDLFASWRQQRSFAHGTGWDHGRSWLHAQLDAIPDDTVEAVGFLLNGLGIDPEGEQAYLTALLLSINGWASWCAYLRWQARLQGSDDQEIVGLLAIRLTWEWLLRHDHDARPNGATRAEWKAWAASWTRAEATATGLLQDQQVDWVLQCAAEHAYQRKVIGSLTFPGSPSTESPAVQAVFCIDVRSEVFRRALESVRPDIRTRGFAGFFGLPIAYAPLGSTYQRPQLPGLLSPSLAVSDSPADPVASARIADHRAESLDRSLQWGRFRSAPASVFSFVESMGLLYGPKLAKESLAHSAAPWKWEHQGLEEADASTMRPHLALVNDDPAAAAAIGYRVLRGMSLVDGFAPIVMLCGHGSQSTNNPHAAGLDCGACGGQSGDVNARVLADLLNAPAVRTHLAELGITIPSDTWFVPALHNTTTDEVNLFDLDLAPASHQAAISALQAALGQAGDRAREERADALGLRSLGVDELRVATAHRANDWSQVRPEWGLAGNAAFIVAPRSRTQGHSLGGRAFLHDYDWRVDPDLATLTLIMTAPMVVTNWINMQYHASTVDNGRYGTGNKVLHNVVGGRIGVFEGNGGDLRIGLSMQSVHDGTTLRHPPLRLSVFIEAPQQSIEQVMAEHEVVRDLVGNGWLHLCHIDPESGVVSQWVRGQWHTRPHHPQGTPAAA